MSHLIPKKKIKEGSKYKIEILSELLTNKELL
jgi:hypothetical protein